MLEKSYTLMISQVLDTGWRPVVYLRQPDLLCRDSAAKKIPLTELRRNHTEGIRDFLSPEPASLRIQSKYKL